MVHDTITNPPGGWCWKFTLLSLLWALVVVPAGSFLYALAVYHLAWVSAAVLALFTLAFMNGYGVVAAAMRSGCRSKSAMYAAAILLGLWSVYLTWVGWVWVLNDYWSLGLIFDPTRLGRVVSFVAEDNYRLMGDRRVPAWEWFIYWGLEALVLILVPAAVVRNTFLKKKKKALNQPTGAPDNGSSESLPSRQ
jgi:hypothetical protein